MESLMENLELAESKKDNIYKSFEQAQAQASSILSFTLQWKEVDDQFELTKDSLLKQAQALAFKEKKLEETTRLLEKREQEVETKLISVRKGLDEIQMKEKQLGSSNMLVQKSALEISSTEQQLNLARKELDSCNGLLNTRREQLALVQLKLEECNKELGVKNKLLSVVQKSIEECNKELGVKNKRLGVVQNSIEERSRELESKEMELSFSETRFEECCAKVRAKNGQLEVCSKELEKKVEEVEKVKVLASNCKDELELKQKELSRVKNLICYCSVELKEKEKQVELLRDLSEKCSGELDLKKSKLDGMEESMNQCVKELDLKKKELDETQKILEECLKDISLKEKELIRVQNMIEERSIELDSKQQHLDSIQVLIEENMEELEVKEKQYDAMNKAVNECSTNLKMKEREVELIEESIKNHSSKLQSEDKKLHSIQTHSKSHDKELKLKAEELKSLEEKIKTYCVELQLKERELKTIQESIRERNEELKLKEKQLTSIQTLILENGKQCEALKSQQIFLQKSMVEPSEELESKKRKLDFVRKSLEDCSDKLALKEGELDSVRRKADESSKELEETRNYGDLLKKSLEERLSKILMKEKQLGERVKEFELKEKQLDLMKKSADGRCKQVELKREELNGDFHSQPQNVMANNTVNPLTEGLQRCIAVGGRNLQLYLNAHFIKHDSVLNEIFTAIQKSPDPGKLVLDSMQGFYPLCLKEDMEFDLNVVRRSCTTLLEKFMKLSPQIKPQIREAATKLAHEWKSKILAAPENTVEVLGFLKLLAAFKLASAFSADELRSLFDTVSQQRQDFELREALGIAESLSGSHIYPSPSNIMQTEHLHVSDAVHSLSDNRQSSVTIDERAPLILDEDMNGVSYSGDEIFGILMTSLDPAKLVLEIIQDSCSKLWKNIGADAGSVNNMVMLMDQLLKISPTISPLVKESAMKLVVSWKANLRPSTENSLEVWAFFLFIAIYGDPSFVQRDVLLSLFSLVAHYRQAPKIYLSTGFAAKIPVPEFIQFLIRRKQLTEAVRFSYAFGLMDRFPPELILKQYLDIKNGKESIRFQDEAIRKASLCALRSVLDCVSEFKFESMLMTWNSISCIAELVKQKSSSISSSSSSAMALDVEQHQGGIHGSRDMPSPVRTVPKQIYIQNLRSGLQPPDNNKRPRISMSIDMPKSAQVPTKSTHNDVINVE